MIGVSEDGDKALVEASIVGRKHVTQPVERLHEAHSGTACPVETAGRGGLEIEGEVAEDNGPQATIGKNADARRDSVGESKVVGGGEAIDHHPDFALPDKRVDHVARVWIGRLSGKAVILGDVVEAARNPSQAFGSNQPVEGLIDRRARSKVGEVLRGPDVRLRRGGGSIPDGGWNAGCLSGHGLLLCQKNATHF